MMRDFRDAKAMAHSLREAVAAKRMTLGHSESLEIISKIFGAADWNTLSALINAHRSEATGERRAEHAETTLPAFPIKDLVPFPNTQLPLWIKRPRTVQALNQAFSNRRRLVLVAQRNPDVQEPGEEDVYDIGVIAHVLDVGAPSAEAIARGPALEGTTQVLLQTHSRVAIRNFSGHSGRYEARVEQIDEGLVRHAPDLIEEAAAQFEAYVAARNVAVPPMWPPLRQLHDPGRVADIIAHRLPLPLRDKQCVLGTLDPVERLQRIVDQMVS